jgi:hypothetical protein
VRCADHPLIGEAGVAPRLRHSGVRALAAMQTSVEKVPLVGDGSSRRRRHRSTIRISQGS